MPLVPTPVLCNSPRFPLIRQCGHSCHPHGLPFCSPGHCLLNILWIEKLSSRVSMWKRSALGHQLDHRRLPSAHFSGLSYLLAFLLGIQVQLSIQGGAVICITARKRPFLSRDLLVHFHSFKSAADS